MMMIPTVMKMFGITTLLSTTSSLVERKWVTGTMALKTSSSQFDGWKKNSAQFALIHHK